MAAIGLAVVGASLAGSGSTVVLGTAITYASIGSAVFGAIGAAIDSQFLFPALFGRGGSSQIAGPRIDDVRVQTASEGSPIKVFFGPSNREAGTIIWAGPLVQEQHDISQGGKGGFLGGGGTTPSFSYFLDLAIGIGEGATGPIARIKRIYAGDSVVYDNGLLISTYTVPERTYTATTISAVHADGSINDSANGFADILEDATIHVSGFTGAVPGGWGYQNYINGTYRVKQKVNNGKLILDIPFFSTGHYIDATFYDDAAGESVTIKQDAYTRPAYDSRYEHIAIYKGTEDQMPNALIESHEGAGNVPGYRGLAYVVFKRLYLGAFSNAIPEFTFEVEGQPTLSVADAIKALLTRAGISANSINMDRVPGCLSGYVVAGPTETTKALEPLLMKQNLLIQESNGLLIGFARGEEVINQVSSGDLAAASADSRVQDRPFRISDTSGFDLPGAVTVTYIDPDNGHQQGNQTFTRIASPNDNVMEINVPLTMTTQEAQTLARQLLWQAWAERLAFHTTLPPTYWYMLEGEAFQVSYQGEDYIVRIDTLTQGANYLLDIRGVITETQASQATDDDINDPIVVDPGTDPGTTPQPYIPPALTTYLLDVPALREADTIRPGLYAAVCATDPLAQWRSASLWRSANDTDYMQSTNVALEVALGYTNTILPPGPEGYWDISSTVEVTMLQGALESATEDQVLGGANWAVIGREIIGYTTATLIGANRYRLSHLLRGLRCTHYYIPNHTVEEPFVPVSLTNTPFVPFDTGLVGSTQYLKSVPAQGVLGDTTPQTVTIGGATLKQFCPVDITGSRDGSNNLTINWVRRSRAFTNILAPGDGPLLAETEAYELDVYNGPTFLRTIAVTATTSGSYSAADQTTDGLTPGDPVGVIIYQMNSVVGRGFPSDKVVL